MKLQKIGIWYRQKPTIIILSLLGAVCFLVPWLYILGIFLILASYTVLLKRLLPVSSLISLFLAGILFYSVNSLLSFILWAIHIPFIGPAAGLLNAVILLSLSSLSRIVIVLPRYSGVLVAAACVLSFSALTIPFIHDRSPATIVKLIIQGEDNISHIELTKNVIRHNGLAFSNNAIQETHLVRNLAGYPQAMHANMALVIKSFMNVHAVNTAYRFLVIYYFLASAIYSLLIGALVLTIMFIAGLLKKSRLSVGDFFILAICSIGLGATIFLGLFSSGFLTYLITPALLLLIIIFLTAAANQQSYSQKRAAILIAATFCAAMQFTWLFLLPVVLPAFALAVFRIENITLKMVNISSIYAVFRRHAWAAAILLVSCLQLLVQYKTSAVNIGVNDPGYIYRLPISYIVMLLALVTGFFLLTWARSQRLLRTYAAFLVMNIIFTIAIYVFQKATINELRYYFFKSEYSIIFLAWPLLVTGLIISLDYARNLAKESVRNGDILLVGLVIVISLLVYKQFVRPNIDTFWPYRWSLSDSATDDLVLSGYKFPSETNYIVLGQCSKADDYKLSRLSTVLSEGTSQQIRSIYLNILTDEHASKLRIYNELLSLPVAERNRINLVDVGSSLPDTKAIHQTNLIHAIYPSVCSPLI